MRTLLPAICAASALMVGAGTALAHDDDDYYGGERGYYGNGYYDGYSGGYSDNNLYWRWANYWRQCQRHARFHQRLNQAHEDLDEQGYDYYGEHRDTHEELNEAHARYHQYHPGSDYCLSYNAYRTNWYRGYRY